MQDPRPIQRFKNSCMQSRKKGTRTKIQESDDMISPRSASQLPMVIRSFFVGFGTVELVPSRLGIIHAKSYNQPSARLHFTADS
jgi:hypothetical protein